MITKETTLDLGSVTVSILLADWYWPDFYGPHPQHKDICWEFWCGPFYVVKHNANFIDRRRFK